MKFCSLLLYAAKLHFYDKKWENSVTLSCHDQLALDTLDIWPRSWPRTLKLTRLGLIIFVYPWSKSQPNIQRYLIMAQWITLPSLTSHQSKNVQQSCTSGFGDDKWGRWWCVSMWALYSAYRRMSTQWNLHWMNMCLLRGDIGLSLYEEHVRKWTFQCLVVMPSCDIRIFKQLDVLVWSMVLCFHQDFIETSNWSFGEFKWRVQIYIAPLPMQHPFVVVFIHISEFLSCYKCVNIY